LAELGTSPAWYWCFNCEVAYRPLQRLRRKYFTESRQLGACDKLTAQTGRWAPVLPSYVAPARAAIRVLLEFGTENAIISRSSR